MSRIRYLKPDFFTDEDIGYLTVFARLGYQGLWVHADREGRLEDRPRVLKIQILPYDDVDMEGILQELALPKRTGSAEPFIIRYGVNGKKYIQILKFLAHQKPHHTERKSVIPPPPNRDLTVKEPLKDGEYPVGMGSKREVKDKEKEKGKLKGMGSKEGKTTAANGGGNGLGAIPPPAADPDEIKLATVIEQRRREMGLLK